MTAEDRKNRLARLSTVYIRSPVYFVTACTHNRTQLLGTKDMHDGFVTFAKHGAGHGAWIGNYVLMPDHLHLFVAIDDDRITLAGWGKSLKNSLSKTLRS